MSSKSRRAVLRQRLASARRSEGLTQGQLAARVGVTRQAVGNWEAGRSAPREEHLPALEAALALPARTLSDILALNPPAAARDDPMDYPEFVERLPRLTDQQKRYLIALYHEIESDLPPDA